MISCKLELNVTSSGDCITGALGFSVNSVTFDSVEGYIMSDYIRSSNDQTSGLFFEIFDSLTFTNNNGKVMTILTHNKYQLAGQIFS